MIIGITGMIGAGKGFVVDYLVQKHGFKHLSVRSFLIEEINARALPVNRDSMTLIANEIRATHGAGYIIQTLLSRAVAEDTNTVIESIRTLGEAHYLKETGARLWSVEAPRALRYERIVSRASETDHVSFEKFCADEEREANNPEAHKGNIMGVIALADVHLLNEDTPEALFAQIDVLIA